MTSRSTETPSGVASAARPQPDATRSGAARAALPALGATAVVLATTPAEDGGPAAALPLEGGTPLRRLLAQLADLGVERAHLVTRPAWRGAVETELAAAPVEAAVVESDGLRGDLEAIAAAAGAGAGTLLVGHGELVVHATALAGLVDDPRIATGVLGRNVPPSEPLVFPFRGARGRVLSAGSAYHRVERPTGTFLGVLKADARDRAAVAGAAGRLAALVAEPPAEWTQAAERSAADAVARDDAVALLVVGLVRGGTHVTNTDVRALHWSRPLSRAAAERSAGELAAADEDRLRLDSAVKATDGFWTTFFVSPYSKHLARLSARAGLTPNAVTTISMAIGVAAAAAFATGERTGMVAGAVLLQLAFAADCVDGQLARYTRRFSTLGAWLDSVFDRGKEYVVYAGLAIGSARGFDDDVWALAAAALTLQTVRHAFDFSFNALELRAVAAAPSLPLERSGDADPLADPAPAPSRERAAPPAPASPLRRLSRTVLGWSRLLDAVPWSVWLKRMIVFPIGERFAIISILAALSTPRAVFLVVLAWGALGALYALAGRLMRSVLR